MKTLLNDNETRGLDILLIQEPPLNQYSTHVQLREWICYRPNLPDVTAVQLRSSTQTLLLFSVYIPPVMNVEAIEEERLHNVTQAIQDTNQAHASDSNASLDVITGGDFDRQHPTWGDDDVKPDRAAQATGILTFMRDLRPSKEAASEVCSLHMPTRLAWPFTYLGLNLHVDHCVRSDRTDELLRAAPAAFCSCRSSLAGCSPLAYGLCLGTCQLSASRCAFVTLSRRHPS